MGIAADLRVLLHMRWPGAQANTHQGRLEDFYGPQAQDYDSYRRRLLHGREELIRRLDFPDGGRMLDLGGGTGSNIECLGERRALLASIRIVDLCPSLLKIADERISRHGWKNVSTSLADATTFESPEGPVDVITFSYSLTMIPDWFQAIDRAWALLKPGGMIGVADFYVSRRSPTPGMREHSHWQRWFWRSYIWRAACLSPDHLPYLQSRFQTVTLEERFGSVPYLFGLKAPYYLFVGRRANAAT